MIRETADELRTIAQSCNDAAGYFPAMYSRVTTQIANSIDAHMFADGDRMNVFATEFASRYTRAFTQEIPRASCWQASWDVADDGNLLIVQQLLLGINAHVNYDLPQAVAEVAPRNRRPRRCAPRLRRRQRRAGRHVGGSAPRARPAVALDQYGRGSRRRSPRSTSHSAKRARRHGTRLSACTHSTTSNEREYVAELDGLVSVLAYLITRPPIPVAVLAFFARLLEQHDPKLVTAGLLAVS